MTLNTGNIVASIIASVSVLAAGGALKYAFDIKDDLGKLNTSIEVMKTQVASVQSDTEADVSQNRQLSRQWVIISTHRDWINDLRVAQGKGIVSWPSDR